MFDLRRREFIILIGGAAGGGAASVGSIARATARAQAMV